MAIFRVWAMIETPRAVLNLAAIAGSGAACLLLGTNDLLKDMHGRPLPDRRNLWAALTQTVMAARAHGLAVIDGTYNDIRRRGRLCAKPAPRAAPSALTARP